MLSRAHILITGGLGAIGSAMCRALLKRDIVKLIIIDDLSSSNKEIGSDILSDDRTTLIESSIVDDNCMQSAKEHNPHIVVHLAAHFANQNSVDHPLEDCMVNSIGTLKVLELAKECDVKKFIYASSSCVYGHESSSAVDSHTLRLDTPYAINKLHGEYLVKFYHEFHGLNTTIVRYFNSFGAGELPGRYRSVIPNFFSLAMDGRSLPITGSRLISRDFNYIDNSVSGTIAAIENPISRGKTYNIGSGVETSIYDLAEMINHITGNKAGIEKCPARSWDSIPNRCADISKTTAELQYAPIIDLENQLMKTFEWLKEHRRFFQPL